MRLRGCVNQRQISRRTAKTSWERSTVWGILRIRRGEEVRGAVGVRVSPLSRNRYRLCGDAAIHGRLDFPSWLMVGRGMAGCVGSAEPQSCAGYAPEPILMRDVRFWALSVI